MGFLKSLKIFIQTIIGGIIFLGGKQLVHLDAPGPFTEQDYIGLGCCVVGFIIVMSAGGINKKLS